MSRTLNLRGTFTEGESRNLNGRILRNSSNPNPPPRVVSSNDFDRYINILKANNRYPIPKELTLPIYTTPYTLDKDLYLAKDSVISFFGTSPAYLNKFALSNWNNIILDISDRFNFTTDGIAITTSTDPDKVLIYIEYLSNFYRVTFIVHRSSDPVTWHVPANSYYFTQTQGNPFDAEEIPAVSFYEGDQSILLLSAPSTPTTEGNAQIVTSSLITRFVFTSN